MKIKNINRFRILSLIVLVTAAVTVCKAGTDTKKIEAAVSNLEREDGTKWTVDEAMSRLGLKGLSAAVIENYQIAWTRTWGVKQTGSGEPIDKETAFSAASIAKPITATLLSILAEKGLIDLDIPVANYLKRWKLPANEFTRSVDITLRHLLNHTAGTTQHGYKDFYIGDKLPDLVQVLEGGELPGTEKIKVDFKPGTK